MRKTNNIKSFFVVTSALFAFAFGMVANIESQPDDTLKLTICSQVEASRWSDMRDDFIDDYRRESRDAWDDIRREHRRNAERAREEQINIARADGDPRFKNDYLDDEELMALRTLKSLPAGREIFLEVMRDEAREIDRMCDELPEFSFVKYNEDKYGEHIGCTVYRSKYLY